MKRQREEDDDDSRAKVLKTEEENVNVSNGGTVTLPTPTTFVQPSDGMASSGRGNRINLQSGMFLRISYWLNVTLTKSVNAGLYAFDRVVEYEPCVMLANTDRKVFAVTHEEWNRMMTYINDVTVCLVKKERKTIFVPGDDDIFIAFTIRMMFGKMYVQLYRFNGEEKTSPPFVLTVEEWNVMVNHIPNVNGHLSRLVIDKVTINERIRNKLMSTMTERVEGEVVDSQGYDRLAEEVTAFMRQA